MKVINELTIETSKSAWKYINWDLISVKYIVGRAKYNIDDIIEIIHESYLEYILNYTLSLKEDKPYIDNISIVNLK